MNKCCRCGKKHSSKIKTCDLCREYVRSWKKANTKKVSAQKRRWDDKNPDKYIARIKKYEKRLYSAPGGFFSYNRPEYKARIMFYGGKCAYCKTASAKTLDHAIPLSRGGSNHPSNIYPACKPCNLSKGSKKLSEWMAPSI